MSEMIVEKQLVSERKSKTEGLREQQKKIDSLREQLISISDHVELMATFSPEELAEIEERVDARIASETDFSTLLKDFIDVRVMLSDNPQLSQVVVPIENNEKRNVPIQQDSGRFSLGNLLNRLRKTGHKTSGEYSVGNKSIVLYGENSEDEHRTLLELASGNIQELRGTTLAHEAIHAFQDYEPPITKFEQWSKVNDAVKKTAEIVGSHPELTIREQLNLAYTQSGQEVFKLASVIAAKHSDLSIQEVMIWALKPIDHLILAEVHAYLLKYAGGYRGSEMETNTYLRSLDKLPADLKEKFQTQRDFAEIGFLPLSYAITFFISLAYVTPELRREDSSVDVVGRILSAYEQFTLLTELGYTQTEIASLIKLLEDGVEDWDDNVKCYTTLQRFIDLRADQKRLTKDDLLAKQETAEIDRVRRGLKVQTIALEEIYRKIREKQKL
jgi:hypothetical protein